MPKSDKDKPDTEVDTDETGDEGKSDTQESKRISDLMSKWQSEEAARKRLEAEKATVEEELGKLKVAQMSESEKLQYELGQAKERAARAEKTVSYYELNQKKAEVLKEFPRASKLSDLIFGESEEEIRNVAKDIENRLKGEEESQTQTSDAGEPMPPHVDLDNPPDKQQKPIADDQFSRLSTKDMKKSLPVKEDDR